MKAGTSRFLIAAMALLLSSGVAFADTVKEKGMMTDKQTMEKQGAKTMKEEKGDKPLDRKMTVDKKTTGKKSMDEGRTMEKGQQKEMK